jgi:hypothetical protein
MFLVSILLYWLGLNYLKVEFFPQYFNPKKHVIVKQNPDTKEIYAWKDASGQVYTPEDAGVESFTWATTALLMFVMIFSITIYNLAIKYYTKMLLEKEPKLSQSFVNAFGKRA